MWQRNNNTTQRKLAFFWPLINNRFDLFLACLQHCLAFYWNFHLATLLWRANHRLQKVCICWRPSNHSCYWRLAGSGRGAEQGHGNRRWIPPDLEAKAQHNKNGVGSLPPNDKEAKSDLKVNNNNETLPFCFESKYLRVTLDTSLTYSGVFKGRRARHLPRAPPRLFRGLPSGVTRINFPYFWWKMYYSLI